MMMAPHKDANESAPASLKQHLWTLPSLHLHNLEWPWPRGCLAVWLLSTRRKCLRSCQQGLLDIRCLPLQYLSEMQAVGLPANSDIYMAVMNGLGEKGCWQEAEALFQEMQGMDEHLHELNYSALIGAYGYAFQHGRCRNADVS